MYRFYSTLWILLFAFSGNAQVTYHKDIRPILTAYCVSCHAKGNIGPMPLTNYKEVSAYGKMIEVVVRSGRMPPYKAETGDITFKNIHALSRADINLIKQWIDSGLTEGIDKTLKPAKPITQQHLDRTDKIFAMKQRFIPAKGHGKYAQIFVIPADSDTDILIDALEFVPGNRRIVKSCAIAIDTTESATELDGYDLKYGYANFGAFAFMPSSFMWYQWTPDQGPFYLPEGYAKKIPARSKLLFYVNYMPAFSAIPESDSSYLKVRIAKNAESKVIASRVLIDTASIKQHPFFIRRDEQKQYVSVVTLQKATTIFSITPMGQYVCRSWEIQAIDPVKKTRMTLLRIPAWDYNWRRKYDLQEPIILAAGMQIKATAVYDNTSDNMNLPILPPQATAFGESVRQEMFMVAFDVNDD